MKHMVTSPPLFSYKRHDNTKDIFAHKKHNLMFSYFINKINRNEKGEDLSLTRIPGSLFVTLWMLKCESNEAKITNK